MSETVIEHVLRRLKSIGIDHVFGVPGDYAFPVEDAIVNFLKAIEEEYPDLTYFSLASGSTGAGMINHCFENPPLSLNKYIEKSEKWSTPSL